MSIHVYSLSAYVSVIDSSCAIAELLSGDVNHSCRAKKRVKVAKEGHRYVLLDHSAQLEKSVIQKSIRALSIKLSLRLSHKHKKEIILQSNISKIIVTGLP